MKKAIIYVLMLAISCIMVLGDTMERQTPSSAQKGSTFDITYKITTPPSGNWVVAMTDDLTGGCEFDKSGTWTTHLSTGWTGGPSSNSPLTVTVRTPSSGTACTFKGWYAFDVNNKQNFNDKTISLGGTPPDCSCASSTCIGSTCNNGQCQGTKVCGDGSGVVRELPTSVAPGGTITVTYKISGVTGSWGITLDDKITCTSGTATPARITEVWTSPSNSKSFTITAPSSAGTCSFDGNYILNSESQKNLQSQSVTISGTSVCDNDGTCDSGETTTNCANDCKECTKDSDCTTGKICKDEKCVTKETKCSSNTDCQFYEKCESGACKINVNTIIMIFVGLFGFMMLMNMMKK